MRRIKLPAIAVLVGLLTPELSFAQSQVLAGWDFDDGTLNANVGTAENLSTAISFTGAGNSLTTIEECGVGQVATAFDWQTGDAWVTADVSTVGFENISISFRQFSRNIGPSKVFDLEYSIDQGSSWTMLMDDYEVPRPLFCSDMLNVSNLYLNSDAENTSTLRFRWKYTNVEDASNYAQENFLEGVVVRGWSIPLAGYCYMVDWDTLHTIGGDRIQGFSATFSEAIDPASVSVSDWLVQGAYQMGITGAVSTVGNVVSFYADEPFLMGDQLVCTLRDLNGMSGSIATPRTWSYAVPGGYNPFATLAAEPNSQYSTVITRSIWNMPTYEHPIVRPVDFDGDGDVDIVAVPRTKDNNSISAPFPLVAWENDGSGNGTLTTLISDLKSTQSTTALFSGAYEFHAADFNNDGLVDFHLKGVGRSHFYINDGTGGYDYSSAAFGGATDFEMVLDIDKDGDLDVVCVKDYIASQINVQILLNPGDGLFTDLDVNEQHLDNIDGQPSRWNWGDVDGDGDIDLVAHLEPESNTVYGGYDGLEASLVYLENIGLEQFEASIIEAETLVIEGTAAGTQKYNLFYSAPFVLDDFDGDGWLDVIMGSTYYQRGDYYSTPARLYKNGGTGEWTNQLMDIANAPETLSGASVQAGLYQVADVDGNGTNDYVAGSQSVFQFLPDYYFQNNAVPNWQLGDYQLQDYRFADFNGDGKLDLMTGAWWVSLMPAPPTASSVPTTAGCDGSFNELVLDDYFSPVSLGNLDYTLEMTYEIGGSTTGFTISLQDSLLTIDGTPVGVDSAMYKVTAVDDITGTSAFKTFWVQEKGAPYVSDTTITFASTSTSLDGAIDVTVSGGSGTPTYLWSNGATTEDLTGIAAGTYTLIVDGAGCRDTIEVAVLTLNTPPAIVTQPDSIAAPGGGPATPGSNPWLTLDLTPHVTDVDGDNLTYTKVSSDPAAWTASIEIADGDTLLKVDFSPAGVANDTVRVEVSDGIAVQVATILIPVFELEALTRSGGLTVEAAVPPSCANGVCRMGFTGGAGTRTVQFCDSHGNAAFTLEFDGDLDETIPQGRYYICGVWDEIGSYLEFNPPLPVTVPCTSCD